MKYILTTGCSFTNNIRLNPDNPTEIVPPHLRSWPYYLQQELGNEYAVLNYGGATNDNISMCRIMLYHIDRMIKENINPKDIKIVIQWSSATRQAIYMNKQLDYASHNMGHTLVYHNNWEKTPGVFYLTGGFDPPTGKGSAIEWLGIENAVKYWQAEIMWNNTINNVMHWFETWLLLEKTCKELEIDVYYMNMWDTFSHQAECNFLSRKPTEEIWMSKVEVLKPYIEKLPIKSDRHWFHKHYKGLLEWAIDNRDDSIPIFQECMHHQIKTYDEFIEKMGGPYGHPSAEMMEIFVKTELLKLLKL